MSDVNPLWFRDTTTSIPATTTTEPVTTTVKETTTTAAATTTTVAATTAPSSTVAISTPPTLPNTGVSHAVPLGGVGLALAAIGAIAVGLTRRRA